MEFLVGAFFSVAILFMLTFMFIGIWSFIVYLKNYRQRRYHNYILEKITQQLSLISAHLHISDEDHDKYAYLTGEEDFEFTDKSDDNIDNLSDFNKHDSFRSKS